MIFHRFEVPGLSHYSYAVGCPAAEQVAIVDPERNVDRYLDWAASEGVEIAHVLETHIHADYASGARELAGRAGAVLSLSDYDDGELYEVAFEHEGLEDGDGVDIGAVRLQALHTPGHTPEHLSFLVFEKARSETVPQILLSGDFLFVGSLGRPDLLGEEAKRQLARQLYTSVRERLAALPDGLEVAPAHGAGSMCGAGLGGRPTSTLGYERVANPYLAGDLDEDTFVERILGSVPPFPPYYRRMKELNAAGPDPVADLPPPRGFRPGDFEALVEDEDAVVVDLREHLAFGGAHIPGALNIGLVGDLATWAAWLVPYDRPILLVGGGEGQAREARRRLLRVGLDDVRGYLQGGLSAWSESGRPLAELPELSARQVHDALAAGEIQRVLDVRSDPEWEQGHIAGAVHVHGGLLAGEHQEVPSDGESPMVVVCGTGYRSSAVASLLQRRGVENLINLTGGMDAWHAAGLPEVEPA